MLRNFFSRQNNSGGEMPFHEEKKTNYEKLFFRLPHKRFLVYFVWYTGKRRLRRWFIHRMHAKEKGGGWRLEVGFGREWKPKWIEALRVAVPRNFRTNILLTFPHLFPAFPDSSHFITQPGSHRIASHHISQTFCTWFNVTPRQRPSRPWLGREPSLLQLPFGAASICCVCQFSSS